MPSFTQNAKLSATFANLGPNDLLLERFVGVERLSEPFAFDLHLLAVRQTPIPFDKLIGQSVTVRLVGPSGSIRFFNGIVSRLIEGNLVTGAEGEQTFIRYRAVMVPAVHKLKLQMHSRIFQQTAMKDILQTVFKGYPVDMQGVADTFPPRNYCVQYEESDFAFASRLMEEDGIFYYFKHTENSHRLVLTSTKPTTAPVEVAYDPSGDNKNKERVYLIEKMQELTSAQFTVWDYHFQAANTNPAATVQVPQPVKVGEVSHTFELGGNTKFEQYRHGQFAHHFDAINQEGSENSQVLSGLYQKNTNRATLHMERSVVQAMTLEGDSTCPTFGAGAMVEMRNHFRGPTQLLLTEVRHEVSVEGAFTSRNDKSYTYANHFLAIPATLQYRPQVVTPRPRILGYQTAMVVAAENKDQSTERYGRVEVQFYWDPLGKDSSIRADGNPAPPYQYWDNRREGAPSCSCWLRVSQPWSGGGFGSLCTPRKGMEVIVVFADGDPDRPLIVGSAYNSLNAPPFLLPQEADTTGLKTQTIGGNSNQFNGLAFVDTKGSERVQLQSEGTLIIRTEGDLIFDVGGNILHNVAGIHRTTHGSLPGPSSGSGGGGGPAPPLQVHPSASDSYAILVAPDLGRDAGLILASQGSGSGGTSQSGSFDQWEVSADPSQSANQVMVSYGFIANAIVGLSGSISLPCNYAITIDPISLMDNVEKDERVAPSQTLGSKSVGLVRDVLAGSQNLALSDTSTFVYGLATAVSLLEDNTLNLYDSALTSDAAALCRQFLQLWSQVTGVLIIAEIGVLGGVSDLQNQENTQIAIENVMGGFILTECLVLQAILSRCAIRLIRFDDLELFMQSVGSVTSQMASGAAECALGFFQWIGSEIQSLLTMKTNP